VDLAAGYRARREEIDQAVHRVLEKGWYILGQEVKAFEEEFARYVGVRHCVGVANGTDALHVALRAAGIRPGDRVVTVSDTAVATVAAVELAGATPVLVDIDPSTHTLDPNRLAETLKEYDRGLRPEGGPRPRAVIPVHLYGHPADMPAILEIARRYELLVIEDCAQAHGAALAGRRVGTWGHLATFSFYPTKNLGALGDGGAVVTDDAALAEQVRLVREYGWKERYISHLAGMNSRLDELQAAVLRVKLKYLDADNARRREIAGVYDRYLAEAVGVTPPGRQAGIEHAFHLYVIRSRHRDRIKEYLKHHGVGTLIHYPAPVHEQPAYRGRVPLGAGGLPHTEQACREILSLPMYPQLADEQARYVAWKITEWARETSA
jgi:dTDP-4-amino-4,6-dideoxygalactose transaminase